MNNPKLARVVGVLNIIVSLAVLGLGAVVLVKQDSADWGRGAKLIAWALVIVPPLVLAGGGVGLYLGGDWGRKCSIGYAGFGVLVHLAGLVIYLVSYVLGTPVARGDSMTRDVRLAMLAAALVPTLLYDIFLLAALLRTKISVIARRELASVFTSPLAYVWGAVFLFVVGFLFTWKFHPGMEASLREMFGYIVWVLVVAVPLLTMPLFSEEYARGTIETMMTAPVSEIDMTLGKFLGVFGFYLLLLVTTVPHFVLLSIYGEPEVGQALMGYFGMLLVGGAFIAIGLFFSSLTRHQLLAALMSAAVLAAITFLPMLKDKILIGHWNDLARYVSISDNFDQFSKGIIDTRSLVYFLSLPVFFLFLTVKVLESRRWR